MQIDDNTRTTRPKPVVLCVLDGWGHRAEATDDNAILRARTPNLDRLSRQCPHAFLQASELHVGLPQGQMGNSEVGHMNLGAGRVVMQDLPRIDQAIASGELARNPALAGFLARLRQGGGRAHVMGLLSPGGVHSHQDQMAALVRLVADAGIEVLVHAFLDGRDTPPKGALGHLAKFEADTAGAGARIVTVSGRYFAMDRDRRWDRVEKAFDALMDGDGIAASDAQASVRLAYERGETDEFVRPSVIGNYAGMRDGDGVLMGNFRADRAREILAALLDPEFDGFARKRQVRIGAALGMVEYSGELNRHMATLFPPETLTDLMGEVVARHGLKQLRIAETEKYAHVTFFFNGGNEREYPGETRIMVPSPKVATYDMKPEMSAYELTDRLVAAIAGGEFDFILVNFANTDMVGHTGDIAAATRAVEAVDACIGRIAEAIAAAGGALLITADHGNAETMRDPQTGEPHTAHTLNPVPVILLAGSRPGQNLPILLRDGKLADVAPTLLQLLGLPQPEAMTGHSLLVTPDDAVPGTA
ncbi:MAG: 2,3-bisphosphoglycerate-independent phosphoglycerate mutase [Alphaproteobacteria bacterium]|nr:2,3-bisphosphoglycerate-independent phosphoglycerate mutase [Alphaproteobacteria bacterium]